MISVDNKKPPFTGRRVSYCLSGHSGKLLNWLYPHGGRAGVSVQVEDNRRVSADHFFLVFPGEGLDQPGNC